MSAEILECVTEVLSELAAIRPHQACLLVKDTRAILDLQIEPVGARLPFYTCKDSPTAEPVQSEEDI